MQLPFTLEKKNALKLFFLIKDMVSYQNCNGIFTSFATTAFFVRCLNCFISELTEF